jgi:hypothetical protein
LCGIYNILIGKIRANNSQPPIYTTRAIKVIKLDGAVTNAATVLWVVSKKVCLKVLMVMAEKMVVKLRNFQATIC